jgi:acyl carrier protein
LDVKGYVVEDIRSLLARREADAQKDHEVDDPTPLFGEGLALDSMEVAELSVLLETRFGRDPFTDGIIPQTVAEIVAYYSESR